MNLFLLYLESFINLNVRNAAQLILVINLNTILIDSVYLNLILRFRVPYFRGKGLLYLKFGKLLILFIKFKFHNKKSLKINKR